MKNQIRTPPCSQAGIVLPTVMIFVLILLALAGTVMNNVMLEEKMSGNLRGQQIAFQAAEQALRYCERYLEIDDHAQIGLVIQTVPGPIGGKEYWEVDTNWAGIAVPTPLAPELKKLGVIEPPRCMAEQMDNLFQEDKGPEMNKKQFRITAKGFGVGAKSKTIVFLQSYLIL